MKLFCSRTLSPLFGSLILLTAINGMAETNSAGSSKSNTTTVYKVVRPDGSISFSDQAKANAEKLEIQPVTTVPSMTVKQNQAISDQSNEQVAQNYYQSLSITSPVANSAFHSGSGNVDVQVQVSPALRPGDQLQFLVNGQLRSTQQSSRYSLKALDRGLHQVTVNIVSSSDKVLNTSTSSFTIHRPSIRAVR